MNLGEECTECTFFFKEVNLLKAKGRSSRAGEGPEWGCPQIVLFYHFFFLFFFFYGLNIFKVKSFGELKRTIESLPPYNGSDAFSSFFLSSSFLPSFNRK